MPTGKTIDRPQEKTSTQFYILNFIYAILYNLKTSTGFLHYCIFVYIHFPLFNFKLKQFHLLYFQIQHFYLLKSYLYHFSLNLFICKYCTGFFALPWAAKKIHFHLHTFPLQHFHLQVFFSTTFSSTDFLSTHFSLIVLQSGGHYSGAKWAPVGG